MYNCPQCFWAFHKGSRWEQATSVSRDTRLRLCGQLGLKHVRMTDGYQGDNILGIGVPDEMQCKSVMAQGGGPVGFLPFSPCS